MTNENVACPIQLDASWNKFLGYGGVHGYSYTTFCDHGAPVSKSHRHNAAPPTTPDPASPPPHWTNHYTAAAVYCYTAGLLFLNRKVHREWRSFRSRNVKVASGYSLAIQDQGVLYLVFTYGIFYLLRSTSPDHEPHLVHGSFRSKSGLLLSSSICMYCCTIKYHNVSCSKIQYIRQCSK